MPQDDLGKLVVAHFKRPYLPFSETFIYQYICNLKKWVPIIVTSKLVNQDKFPTEKTYENRIDNMLEDMPGFARKILNKVFPGKFSIHKRFYLNVLRAEGVKVIHAHFGTQGNLLLPVKRELKLPMLVSFYGCDLSCIPEGLYARTGLFDEAELFTVEGGFARKSLMDLGCPEEKIRILHIGVDLQKFSYTPRILHDGEKVRILFCGRFVEKKGLLYAVKAIGELLAKYEDIEFRIIGDGQQRLQILELIEELNIAKHVVLLGIVSHDKFAEECRKSHIFLAPSVTELNTGNNEGGAPTVLLEAQASGMPVVSTYHADIPEVVVDGETGFLCPERDVNCLAEKLEYLVSHPELWAEIGKSGREHMVRNYNIVTVAEDLEHIYDALVNQ